MADAHVWEAIATLRALLEVVPDSPDGPCRLDTCVAWVRQKVEFETYTPPATEHGVLPTGPISTGVPFPHELDCREVLRQTDESENDTPSLWHTERPWDAINETFTRLRSVLPRLLDAVEMDPILRNRVTRDSQSKSGYLEEDMRGTTWGFLGFDQPVDEKMRTRNNGRLDALAVMLKDLRAKPEVVLEVADAILQRARAALNGWSFDVPVGVISHSGITTTDLPPGVVFFVSSVVNASPDYVKFQAIKRLAANAEVTFTATKLDQILRQLPKHLRDRLETHRGLGTRLRINL